MPESTRASCPIRPWGGMSSQGGVSPLSLRSEGLGEGPWGKVGPQDSCEPQGAQMGPDAACDEVLGLPPTSVAPCGPEYTPGLTDTTTGNAPLLHLSFSWILALLLCSRISRGSRQPLPQKIPTMPGHKFPVASLLLALGNGTYKSLPCPALSQDRFNSNQKG